MCLWPVKQESNLFQGGDPEVYVGDSEFSVGGWIPDADSEGRITVPGGDGRGHDTIPLQYLPQERST